MATPIPTPTTRSALQESLNDGIRGGAWTTESSWALVPISAMPTADELATIRAVAKLTDCVAAVRLVADDKMPPALRQTIQTSTQAAGADVLWLPASVAGWVRITAGTDELGPDAATLLLQAITTVLPSVVAVPKSNVPAVRTCRNLLHSLGDMFTLRVV